MLRGNSVLPDTKSQDPEEEFELLDYLGQGAYGSVSKALHKRTGNLYAIKILKISLETDKAAIAKEIQILKLCNNEHIVRYYGNYEKDNDLWIVLEYCHAGSIIDLINITQRKLNEQEIASILESVLEGLVYLHSNKMIHRDIKAANILLNSEGVAKLADFGVSAESLHTNAKHWSQVGSPYWMSPEVLGRSEYTNKTDIWSLGVTAVELAEGVVPNSNMKPMVAMFQLKNKPLKGFKEPEKWSDEFNSFVSQCLNTNPTLRPQAKTLLKHEFITKNSRGQRLLAELVQNSLSDIQEFRRGVQEDDDTENDIMNMLNASGFGTKTIVNNRTERSHNNAQKQMLQELGGEEDAENFNSSMVINDNEGSMIINNSMVAQEKNKPQPSNFLNKYINGLKHTDSQVESQKQVILRKIAEYDSNCLQEIEQVHAKYRGIITELLASGGDSGLIKEEINSKLLRTDNIKDFLLLFPKYEQRKKESKQFQRSDLAKKKSQFSQMAHHSTQTNDPGYADVSQFREAYPRGVKSQQFNERQFKSTEKHCFNSKSIISDMENVKYSNHPAEEARFCKNDRSNKRFIMTEPYEWTSADSRPPFHNKQPVSSTDKTNIRDMFLSDSVVKSSLVRCMQAERFGTIQPSTIKHDRVAESTLYHDCEDETFKHQNSVTVIRGQFGKNNLQMTLNQEYQGDDNSINVNLFNAKGSTGKSSKNQPKKKKNKRIGSSEKRQPVGKSNAKKK